MIFEQTWRSCGVTIIKRQYAPLSDILPFIAIGRRPIEALEKNLLQNGQKEKGSRKARGEAW